MCAPSIFYLFSTLPFSIWGTSFLNDQMTSVEVVRVGGARRPACLPCPPSPAWQAERPGSRGLPHLYTRPWRRAGLGERFFSPARQVAARNCRPQSPRRAARTSLSPSDRLGVHSRCPASADAMLSALSVLGHQNSTGFRGWELLPQRRDQRARLGRVG